MCTFSPCVHSCLWSFHQFYTLFRVVLPDDFCNGKPRDLVPDRGWTAKYRWFARDQKEKVIKKGKYKVILRKLEKKNVIKEASKPGRDISDVISAFSFQAHSNSVLTPKYHSFDNTISSFSVSFLYHKFLLYFFLFSSLFPSCIASLILYPFPRLCIFLLFPRDFSMS